jgi:DinB superfamily
MTGIVDYREALRKAVRETSALLDELPADVAARRPAPDKWSIKEIVGHLVDSAANNHQRFVRARLQDTLIFPGYAQDDWVAAQQYQDAPWPALVTLWREYNLHIARIMELAPEEARFREHLRHNLHELAWRPVPADRPATLDYFMRDYVGHLQHHLRQIATLLDVD